MLAVPDRLPVGKMRLVSTTSSILGVQTPLLIVHRNITLLPKVRPVTVLLLVVDDVIFAPFAAPTIVHAPEPVPTTGTLPASVKLPLLHCSWSTPAFDIVGVL
jgi:hypothetical protein